MGGLDDRSWFRLESRINNDCNVCWGRGGGEGGKRGIILEFGEREVFLEL